MKFYITRKKQRQGPFTLEQLLAMGIQPQTLVWHEGLPSWKRADEVEALQSILPPPLPEVPPPIPAATPNASASHEAAPETSSYTTGSRIMAIGFAIMVAFVLTAFVNALGLSKNQISPTVFRLVGVAIVGGSYWLFLELFGKK